MPDRRALLLDAALDVVGSRSLRALTHRAVDATAGLPPGSASNVFRTRAELVSALLDRLLERDLEAWERLTGSAPARPLDRDGAVRAGAALMAAAVRALTGPERGLTLARQAVFHEAAFDADLRRRITDGRARLNEYGRTWLARLGLDVDAAGMSVLLAAVNGMLANQIAGPEPDFDPDAALRTVLDAIAAGRR